MKRLITILGAFIFVLNIYSLPLDMQQAKHLTLPHNCGLLQLKLKNLNLDPQTTRIVGVYYNPAAKQTLTPVGSIGLFVRPLFVHFDKPPVGEFRIYVQRINPETHKPIALYPPETIFEVADYVLGICGQNSDDYEPFNFQFTQTTMSKKQIALLATAGIISAVALRKGISYIITKRPKTPAAQVEAQIPSSSSAEEPSCPSGFVGQMFNIIRRNNNKTVNNP